MYSPGEKTPRVGRVSIDIHGKSYRLRFTYPEGIPHSFSVARATEEGWATANRAALLINRDIDLGEFDETYARYSPKHAKKLEKQRAKKAKRYNLKDLWEAYKKASANRVLETTKKGYWRTYDIVFDKVNSKLIELDKARDFLSWLQDNYADSTIASLFRTAISPSINMAVKDELIDKNPFDSIELNKVSRAEIQCFEPDEIKEIIASFYSNKYNPKSSRYQHSFYAPMVEFLALTGCRPEEAHALTWDDIKYQKGKTFIRFNKAYSKKVLIPHTKNHTIRLFPCNQQVLSCLERIPKKSNQCNLIFPGVKRGYISQNDFRRYNWTRVLSGLLSENKVEKYLKPYCLRHSFITRMVREGVDIATVARLSGNSPETIIKHYLASKRDFDLPEL